MPTKCQAKNPATCRIHGTYNPARIVTNPIVAAQNLNKSHRLTETATTFEELQEIKQQIRQDQNLYDATISGLKELQRNIQNKSWTLPLAEELDLKKRYEEALTKREEILKESPAWKEAYETYDNYVAAHGSHKYTIDPTDPELQNKLNQIPPGSPIMLKTHAGSIIYDSAGDGFLPGTKHNILTKNSRKFANGLGISLKNSGVGVPYEEIKEIHTLTDMYGQFSFPPTAESQTENQKNTDHGVWAIEGKEYSYQFEGSRTTTHTNKKGDTIQTWSWEGLQIEPYNPLNITRKTV